LATHEQSLLLHQNHAVPFLTYQYQSQQKHRNLKNFGEGKNPRELLLQLQITLADILEVALVSLSLQYHLNIRHVFDSK
jgi:hypothetical protein